jgi:hypothetical protein
MRNESFVPKVGFRRETVPYRGRLEKLRVNKGFLLTSIRRIINLTVIGSIVSK